LKTVVLPNIFVEITFKNTLSGHFWSI